MTMETKKKEEARTSRMMLGKRGEDIACRFLTDRGHAILERNYRSGHLEIDIISADGNGVHFVEVKSRVAPLSAAPEESVTVTKQRRLARAALGYLHSRRGKGIPYDLEVSFDIITVTFEEGQEKVEWFPQAFIPMYV